MTPFFQDRKQFEEKVYEDEKKFLAPSWSEVGHKEKVQEYFMRFAVQCSAHVVGCTTPGCSLCDNVRAVFCTPEIFVGAIRKRLSLLSQVDESCHLSELWSTRAHASILKDPRYLIFKCNWDEQLVATAIIHQITQNVFTNMGIEVE